jgi:hypothetical protein
MGWWRRRRETLNERMLREAGLNAGAEAVEETPPAPLEPEPRHPGPPLLGGRRFFEETGVTGTARPRSWDVTTTVEAPDLKGEEVEFEVLPDGSILVEEEVGEESLAPLAEAIEQMLAAPYRARAVRRGETVWAVAANGIEVVELPPDVRGNEVDVAVQGDEKTLVVDGARAFGSVPELEQLGASRFESYVVHAERLDGNLWEVRVGAL